LLKGKTFEDVFTEEWRTDILTHKAPCEEGRKRDFAIAWGAIRFAKLIGDTWSLIGVSAPKNLEPKQPATQAGWWLNGKVIPPTCFVRIWRSGDNYEHMTEKFSIDRLGTLRWYPGSVLGKEIPTVDPIETDWPGSEFIVLTPDLDLCFEYRIMGGQIVEPQVGTLKIEEHRVMFWQGYDFSPYGTHYTVIGDVSVEACQAQAPYFSGICIDAKIVDVQTRHRGSMPDPGDIQLYGLFRMPDGKKVMAPLELFPTVNDALNYIDAVTPPAKNN